MSRKGGGRIPIEYFFEAPRQMGERAGLVFNFEKITRAPNTMLSHALIALTPDEKRDSMIEDIYAAYFEHGQDIGDLEVLLKLAEAHEMDPARLRIEMQDVKTKESMWREVEQAYSLDISGVPFFVIDNKYAFSGAQPPEVITKILQSIKKETL